MHEQKRDQLKSDTNMIEKTVTIPRGKGKHGLGIEVDIFPELPPKTGCVVIVKHVRKQSAARGVVNDGDRILGINTTTTASSTEQAILTALKADSCVLRYLTKRSADDDDESAVDGADGEDFQYIVSPGVARLQQEVEDNATRRDTHLFALSRSGSVDGGDDLSAELASMGIAAQESAQLRMAQHPHDAQASDGDDYDSFTESESQSSTAPVSPVKPASPTEVEHAVGTAPTGKPQSTANGSTTKRRASRESSTSATPTELREVLSADVTGAKGEGVPAAPPSATPKAPAPASGPQEAPRSDTTAPPAHTRTTSASSTGKVLSPPPPSVGTGARTTTSRGTALDRKRTTTGTATAPAPAVATPAPKTSLATATGKVVSKGSGKPTGKSTDSTQGIKTSTGTKPTKVADTPKKKSSRADLFDSDDDIDDF